MQYSTRRLAVWETRSVPVQIIAQFVDLVTDERASRGIEVRHDTSTRTVLAIEARLNCPEWNPQTRFTSLEPGPPDVKFHCHVAKRRACTG